MQSPQSANCCRLPVISIRGIVPARRLGVPTQPLRHRGAGREAHPEIRVQGDETGGGDAVSLNPIDNKQEGPPWQAALPLSSRGTGWCREAERTEPFRSVVPIDPPRLFDARPLPSSGGAPGAQNPRPPRLRNMAQIRGLPSRNWMRRTTAG
jgi:hypothetical protein